VIVVHGAEDTSPWLTWHGELWHFPSWERIEVPAADGITVGGGSVWMVEFGAFLDKPSKLHLLQRTGAH
jgi:hypothetical protein